MKTLQSKAFYVNKEYLSFGVAALFAMGFVKTDVSFAQVNIATRN